MVMDAHGGHSWVGMWLARPKGKVCHGNEDWRDTDGPCVNESGVLLMQNTQQNNTAKKEMHMGAVLTGGHMVHK